MIVRLFSMLCPLFASSGNIKLGTIDGEVANRCPQDTFTCSKIVETSRLENCAEEFELEEEDGGQFSKANALGDKSQVGSPVVVGCTMIDMHVSTRIDEHFKVSL